MSTTMALHLIHIILSLCVVLALHYLVERGSEVVGLSRVATLPLNHLVMHFAVLIRHRPLVEVPLILW